MHKHHELPAAFASLGVETPFLKALAKLGFSEPTDVQLQMIPLVLEGRDVLGQARTGTGKTAAFGLPILQMVTPNAGLQVLILVPTRELAVQVAAELRRLSDGTGLRVVPVYGGQRIKHQLHLLGKKPCVAVGTPGRVMDLYQRRALPFDKIRDAVLDEADRMLDIGFRDDIRQILSQVTSEHQTAFVSATVNDDIKRLAARYMTNPVDVDVSRDELTVDEVSQAYISVDPWDKFRMLEMLLAREQPKLAIVFCNTKHGVRKLAKRLHAAGIDAREIHGDLVQQRRERVMERFRKHQLHVLVATDLAARGIDVQGISHIINYDIPDDPYVYVHRIGRTARMGTFGKAITLVTSEQGKQLTEVEKLINEEVPQDSIEGFVSRPPREDYVAPGPRMSRPSERVAEPSVQEQPAAVAAPPRRLGAKFPSRRRKRL